MNNTILLHTRVCKGMSIEKQFLIIIKETPQNSTLNLQNCFEIIFAGCDGS